MEVETDPDLGCIDCEGNEYSQNSNKPNGLVSCWGAIGDLRLDRF